MKKNEIHISEDVILEMNVFINNNEFGFLKEKLKLLINEKEKRTIKLTNEEKKEILFLINDMIEKREKKRVLYFNNSLPTKMKLSELNNINEIAKIRKFRKNLLDCKIL